MKEKVFIDIGAHGGSTADAVFSSGLSFDRVISVEPDPEWVSKLSTRFAEKVADGSYLVAPIAISNRNGAMTLYGDNRGGGASLISSKVSSDDRGGIDVPVVDWPGFIEKYNLSDSDLYIKINCEGGEIMIVDSMLSQGGAQIKSMVIDFDIIKTPFGGWKKWSAIRRLKRAGIPYLLSEAVFIKHSGRSVIRNWLCALPEFCSPPEPRDPLNLQQYVRVKYLELVSAIGIKHDFLKKYRKKKAPAPQMEKPAAALRPIPSADILAANPNAAPPRSRSISESGEADKNHPAR